LSFFDDGEETQSRPPTRAPRARDSAARGGEPGGGGPRPRRPQQSGRSLPLDQHTLMVRRRVAAGVAVVLLIVIVLVVNGCLKSQRLQAMKDYNRNVSLLATESDEQVSTPLFSTINDAAGKSALNVEEQVDQLRIQAQTLAGRAKGLSVPGGMSAAQTDLELTMDLRVEGLTKVAALLPTALGGQGKQASTLIAGDMEIFLASDVVYSQRVAPLIQQTLASNGIHGLSTASTRFLPNLGWLESATVSSRISGKSSSQTGQPLSGHHGSALKAVNVGSQALEPEPALNHISGGSSPTFTVQVEDAGEFPETNVTVNVTVTSGGKQFKASHAIEKTEPAKTASVDIPVTGVPLGAASKIEVQVEPVPGETNHEGTKNTYLAIFGS
jgi:hypothetical protein